MLKYFYDPHPGLMGAVMRLPDILKKAVDKLDNQTLELEDVLTNLEEIGASISAKIENHEDWIAATLKTDDGCTHSWRLIRHKSNELLTLSTVALGLKQAKAGKFSTSPPDIEPAADE